MFDLLVFPTTIEPNLKRSNLLEYHNFLQPYSHSGSTLPPSFVPPLSFFSSGSPLSSFTLLFFFSFYVLILFFVHLCTLVFCLGRGLAQRLSMLPRLAIFLPQFSEYLRLQAHTALVYSQKANPIPDSPFLTPLPPTCRLYFFFCLSYVNLTRPS